MKLASLDTARPGGTLLVVSADLSVCQTVGGIASTLAQALADWDGSCHSSARSTPPLGRARPPCPILHRPGVPSLAAEAWWVAFHPPGAPCLVAAPGDCIAMSPDTLQAELRSGWKRRSGLSRAWRGFRA
jgi:hypothetical protein